ncbi:hypothetical protein SAMN02910358_02149 [Lachnospiraceae bacterium XBB1006]|nr:hypothetical protein SAMN02910358_02149 [Lachnospiraceae bacterium XBB1006]
MKNELILYIHGKGGTAKEAEHYQSLFPGKDVLGLNYKAKTPWEACEEFSSALEEFSGNYDSIHLIANSIGAYFSMHAGIDRYLTHAYFISPMVNLESLIQNMIVWAGTSEAELQEKKTIPVDFGDDLSWDYLQYVRNHPIHWNTPTDILYGSSDNLQSLETIQEFAARTGSSVTVMEGGEHWFHTDEQMEFLDNWILEKAAR